MKESVFQYLQSVDAHEIFAHISLNSSESNEVGSRFILEGLMKGQKCFYISDLPVPSEILFRIKNNSYMLDQSTIHKTFRELTVNYSRKKDYFTYSEFLKQVYKRIASETEKKGEGTKRFIINKKPQINYFSDIFDPYASADIHMISNEKPVIIMYQFQIDRITSTDLLNIMKSVPKIVENEYVYSSSFYINPKEMISSDQVQPSIMEHLTHQERKILRGVVNGHSNKMIADDLSISIRTVEAHRASIMRKLEVNNLVDLVKLAIKSGFI